MKRRSVKFLPCLAIGAAGLLLVGMLDMGIARAPAAIDLAKPDTWEADVARIKRDQDEIAKALISAIKDKERPIEERRKAVFLLGEVHSKESIDFLIQEVSLRLPMRVVFGDEDSVKETPCFYVLAHKGDWNTARAILYAVNVPKPPRDLLHLATVLETLLRKVVAVAAVDQMIEQETRSHTVWWKNLTVIRTHVTSG